ncbi:MAG: hypothetical protein IT374_09630 [Polyangiaceae bacterium]|nr:hypothetical protein [Polyangiaceae bacterium]
MTDPRFTRPPPPAPRELTAEGLEITSSFGGWRRWAGFFMIGHGGVMTTAFSWGLPVDLAIDLGGAREQATVTESARSSSVKINKKRATRVTYSYVVAGETHTESFHTIEPRYVGLAVGAALPVERSTHAPSWSRPVGTTSCFFGYFGLLLALEPLAGIPFLVSGLALRRRARAAWRDGAPTPATLVSKRAGRARKRGSGRAASFRYTWSYPWQHQALLATLESESTLLASLEQGQTVTLLVHPSRPSLPVPWAGRA